MSEDTATPSVHIFGGGTLFHVRPHLALCAPAYGATARHISDQLQHYHGVPSRLHMTKMTGAHQDLETNSDVSRRVSELVADPSTKIIFMSAALCDFEGSIIDELADVDGHTYSFGSASSSGKDQPRLQTSTRHAHTGQDVPLKYTMFLEPAAKIIGSIRKTRKDIFLVGFKTTAGAKPQAQYEAGLKLLKQSSCNLVLANDVHTRLNMVITPEQARYHETTDRVEALNGLIEMTLLRSKLSFTRSTIEEGAPVPWTSPNVPASLREVVDHCIKRGAYKPFLGATVGHFAVKLGDQEFLTSRRKTNFNDLNNVGLVKVVTDGESRVKAYGSRPSVGGQSQRIVFAEHPDTDCIVHAHVPLRSNAPDRIPVRSQREFECGSMECGSNTSRGLQKFDLGDGHCLYAVMLDHHGPNIVFHRNTDPVKVINFIESNFDLTRATDSFA